ncbi:MAG: arsenic resistance protein [Clostridium sp.]|uniref:arsenic resistance protein n=1 Tax=Clostridium sp. TaxID=1506 RepID=UPI003F415E77
MDNINKFQGLIILLMAFLGLLFGQIGFIQQYASYIITPSLIIMLFLVFIQIPLQDITSSFKNTKFTFTSVLINFVWTPLLIFILGNLFLKNSPELLIGFVMLMVTPCTDWYLIFTRIAKGNVALGTSILPLNFLLQLMLLPVYVFLIGGSKIDINVLSLTSGVFLSLIIPLFCAVTFRKLIRNLKRSSDFKETITNRISGFQSYFLNISIIAMFASEGNSLLKNPSIIIKMLLPILLFFIINFILVQFIGKFLNLTNEDTVALTLTTLARNSPVALAIAVATFPDVPLISLVLIIGPLIELPVLFIVSKTLLIIKS